MLALLGHWTPNSTCTIITCSRQPVGWCCTGWVVQESWPGTLMG